MKNSLFNWDRFKGSFIYAWTGIWEVFKNEQNLWIILFISIIVIFFSWYLKLTNIEKSVMILLSASVIAAEVLNTAVEFICDKLHLADHNDTIAILKNIMAGFVLIWSIAAIIIGLLIFLPHL